MMNVRKISLILVLTMFMGSSLAVSGDVSDAADPALTITDGTGKTFVYSKPTEHIVTMGYASTLTVAMLGEMDKIIAVDMYSTHNYTKDDRLTGITDDMSLGSIYTASNNDLIVTKFVQWVEAGKMNLDDTIILTTYTNALALRERLNEVGFTNVLVYLSITDYDQVIDFVKSMSIIVTGKISTLVRDMEFMRLTIEITLSGTTEKAKGMGVWYSTSLGLQVNNTGSITVSLIEAAGGINVGKNPSITAARYGDATTIIQLVEANPDVVIFLSDTYILNGKTVSDFRTNVLGGDANIPVVVVDSKWNNYDPDAAEGLWAFACALYPDLFDGPAPHTDVPSESNLLLYAVGGLVMVSLILGVAYIFMWRP